MFERSNKNKVNEEKIEEVEVKKRKYTKRNKDKGKYQLNKEQNRFVVDLSSEFEVLENVFELLIKTNSKTYGREITFKDLALMGILKLNQKDIEKIQDNSMSDMERVEKNYNEYLAKTENKISMGEYLVKKLNLS